MSNFPYQGLNPGPLQWNHGVLTTGHLGKSYMTLQKFADPFLIQGFQAPVKYHPVSETKQPLTKDLLLLDAEFCWPGSGVPKTEDRKTPFVKYLEQTSTCD